jgi:hypothetical protein
MVKTNGRVWMMMRRKKKKRGISTSVRICLPLISRMQGTYLTSGDFGFQCLVTSDTEDHALPTTNLLQPIISLMAASLRH